MTAWIAWFVLAGLLVILEMFTGTFYLLMIGLGLAGGGIAALGGAGAEMQFVIAALIGALATWGLRRSRFGKIEGSDAARDANVNMDIGETVRVPEWNVAAGASPSARVQYRGALWDVELAPGGVAEPGSFIIREVRGNRLIVSAAEQS